MSLLQGTAHHSKSICARREAARAASVPCFGDLASNGRTTMMELPHSFQIPARAQVRSCGRRAGVCALSRRQTLSKTNLGVGPRLSRPERLQVVGQPNARTWKRGNRPGVGPLTNGARDIKPIGSSRPSTRPPTWSWPSPAWRRRRPLPSTVRPSTIAAVRGGRRRLGAVDGPRAMGAQSGPGQPRTGPDEA